MGSGAGRRGRPRSTISTTRTMMRPMVCRRLSSTARPGLRKALAIRRSTTAQARTACTGPDMRGTVLWTRKQTGAALRAPRCRGWPWAT